MHLHWSRLAALAATASLLAGISSAAAAPLKYVALGDSYTSGPMVGAPASGVPYGCMQGSQNYPHLLAAATGMVLTDVSCGGATTANMTQAQYSGDGFNPPQLDALSADTQVVTLGIGGNDLPFAEFVATCGTLGATNPTGAPCKTYYNRTGTDQGLAKASAVGPKVDAAIRGVRERAPNARVLVVGYPTVVPAGGLDCFSYGIPLAAGDLPYLNQIERQMNAVIKASADANGVEFIDTYTSSQGHDMCKTAGVRWIEGLFPSTNGGPIHPNLAGMQNTMKQVRAILGL